MILTEQGLHFARDGDRWRCVERPRLKMLRDGRFEIEHGSSGGPARQAWARSAMTRSMTRSGSAGGADDAETPIF